MNRKYILIDSNVLIYAINLSSPKHAIAKRFLTENNQNCVVADQNLFETIRVLTHSKFDNPMSSKKAIATVETLTRSWIVISPLFDTKQTAFALIKNNSLSGNKIFDAYLVATMLSNELRSIATDNVGDLSKFKEIEVVNPFITS